MNKYISIPEKVIKLLSDRKGFAGWWAGISPEIQKEILDEIEGVLTEPTEKRKQTLSDFPKMKKDGKIAVLYSPGYGAGWSTWNKTEWAGILTTHRDIVQAVLDDDRGKAGQLAEKIIKEITGESYVCVLGARDLKVEWMSEGAPFQISEHHGYERLRRLDF